MKYCSEKLMELPVQYIYLLHVITVCITNKGASIELLFEMNSNSLFSVDNRFLLKLCLFIIKRRFKILINM